MPEHPHVCVCEHAYVVIIGHLFWKARILFKILYSIVRVFALVDLPC